jgi:hypothetical protein
LPCPACNEPFYYRKRIEIQKAMPVDIALKEEALSASLSPEQQEAIIQIAAERKVYAATSALRELMVSDGHEFEPLSRSPAFPCPNCRAALQVDFQLVVIGVRAVGAEMKKRKKVVKGIESLSEADRELYRIWSDLGLLAAFLRAGTVDNPSYALIRSPAASLRTFKSWIQRARVIDVPRMQLDKLLNEYRASNILCFQCNAVVGVVADGLIKHFLPRSIVFNMPARETLKLSSNDICAVKSDTGPLEVWVKTRYGYTLGRGLFFQALRQECVGAAGSGTRTQRHTQSGLPRFGDEEQN